jgi:hypothetical protein
MSFSFLTKNATASECLKRETICSSGSPGRAFIDSAIEGSAEYKLVNDQLIVLPKIDVHTENGVVMLRGSVGKTLFKEPAA